MRQLTTFIFVCLLFGCTSKNKPDQTNPTKLKVMVWNILHGGKNENLPADGRPDVISIIKHNCICNNRL